MSSVSEQATRSIHPAEKVHPSLMDVGSALGAEIVEFVPAITAAHKAEAEIAKSASRWQNNVPISVTSYSAKDPDGDLAAEQCSHCPHHHVSFGIAPDAALKDGHTCLEWGEDIDLFKELPTPVAATVAAMITAVRDVTYGVEESVPDFIALILDDAQILILQDPTVDERPDDVYSSRRAALRRWLEARSRFVVGAVFFETDLDLGEGLFACTVQTADVQILTIQGPGGAFPWMPAVEIVPEIEGLVLSSSEGVLARES